jgi:hypothetical protein
MLRIWLSALVVLSLAACSSAPPKGARVGGASSRDSALRTIPPGFPHFVDHSIGREEISIQAMSLVGIPYRWGGNTPASGFDCSGLVRYVVARAADVELPRTTADISRRGEAIEPDEIAPGDLIFFNTTGRPHSHVGIYVGKLRFVNAPSTGGTVRLDYLTNSYWAKRFDGIRRVAPPLERPSPFDAPTELAGSKAPAQSPAPAETLPSRVAATGPVAPAPMRSSGMPASPAAPVAQAAVTSAPDQAGAPSLPSPASGQIAATPNAPAGAVSAAPTAGSAGGDAIDAAADAFEPPPPVAVQAVRQARRAGALSVQPATVQPAPAQGDVQVMRASTVPSAVPSAVSSSEPAPTSTADDPIAQFAHSGE